MREGAEEEGRGKTKTMVVEGRKDQRTVNKVQQQRDLMDDMSLGQAPAFADLN